MANGKGNLLLICLTWLVLHHPPTPPVCTWAGVGAAPGAVSGGGLAARQRVGGPGHVPASGGLSPAPAGAQPPGGAAARPPQRQPGRRSLRAQG